MSEINPVAFLIGCMIGLVMAKMIGPILFNWIEERQRRKWKEEHAEENRLWKEKMDKWDAESFAAEADPANGMSAYIDPMDGTRRTDAAGRRL